MTKKHYIHLANIIKRHTYLHDYGRKYIDFPDFAQELSNYFEKDSSLFNAKRFHDVLVK